MFYIFYTVTKLKFFVSLLPIEPEKWFCNGNDDPKMWFYLFLLEKCLFLNLYVHELPNKQQKLCLY